MLPSRLLQPESRCHFQLPLCLLERPGRPLLALACCLKILLQATASLGIKGRGLREFPQEALQ